MNIMLGPARDSLVDYFDSLSELLNSENVNCMTFGDTLDSRCDINLFSGVYKEINTLNDIIVGFEYDDDFEEIIIRDRYLSNIPYNEAVKIVYLVKKNIQSIICDIKPDIVFGDRVDNYILHVFYNECKLRNIKYNIILESYIPGYTRFSDIHGSILPIREVTTEEVDLVKNKIINQYYRPDYFDYQEVGLSALKIFTKLYLKEKVKVFYFKIARFLSGDFLNFHYNTSLMSDKFTFPGVRYFNQIFYKKYLDYDWKPLNNNKTVIYIPLQWFPETSTCYFPDHKSFVFYFESILNVLNTLHQIGDVDILIKEHPFCVGHRKPHIYQKFKDFDNVKIIPSTIHNSEIFKYVNTTIVWQGTTGLESLLRGVNTIFIGRPYYLDDLANYKVVKNQNEIKQLRIFDEYLKSNSNNDSIPNNLLNYGLEGSFDCKLKLMWFDAKNKNQVAEQLKLANEIKKYLLNS